MVASRETAEEQLLRMIEGPQGAGVPPRKPSAGGGRGPSLKRVVDDAKDALVFWWRRLVPRRAQSDAFLWNLKLAQQILWVALLLLGVYVVWDLMVAQSAPRARRLATAPSPAVTEDAVPPEVKAMRPLSEYLSVVMQRNPFTGAIGGIAPMVKTAKRRLQEMTSGLSIVGIDRGPNPVALIEDKGEQRTYIVKTGDRVKEMQVEKIDADGVVLSYEGEQVVLR